MNEKEKTVGTFEIGRTYKCIAIDAWISSDKQNKDASKFLNDKLEIYLDPENYVRTVYNHGIHIEHIPTEYSVFIEDKDKSFFTLVESPVNTTEDVISLDEQSIAESIKTLSRASQEISTHVTVDGKGVVTVYSDYHQEDLVFDTAEKLVQYMKCVKQMNSFVK